MTTTKEQQLRLAVEAKITRVFDALLKNRSLPALPPDFEPSPKHVGVPARQIFFDVAVGDALFAIEQEEQIWGDEVEIGSDMFEMFCENAAKMSLDCDWSS